MVMKMKATALSNKWAASRQNQLNDCVSSENLDQPGHLPSLIRVVAVRMKKAWVLSYPVSAQRRLRSAWAWAQAALSLRWAHMPFCLFCHEAAHMHFNIVVWWIGAQQNQQNDLCSQRRFRSAWAYAQSGQSSPCILWVVKNLNILQMDSEEFSVWADLSLPWIHKSFCWFRPAPALIVLKIV